MSSTPSTYADARALLDEFGHAPRTRTFAGIVVPVDHGREPLNLDDDPDAPTWWPPPYFGDWVSVQLGHDPGPGPVVYRLIDFRNPANARPVLSFRPVDRNARSRWAVRDWSGRDGARSAKPLDSLLTVLGDLDRLSAVIDRTRDLAATTRGEPRSKLWRREAEELAAFRSDHERRNVEPLASQWLASKPASPPTQPAKPRLVPVNLR